MENFINPTVRVSDQLTGGNIKKLLKFIEPFTGSQYIFIPITGDFIDGTFREFQLIRCRTTSESAEKRDLLASPARLVDAMQLRHVAEPRADEHPLAVGRPSAKDGAASILVLVKPLDQLVGDCRHPFDSDCRGTERIEFRRACGRRPRATDRGKSGKQGDQDVAVMNGHEQFCTDWRAPVS